MITFAEGEYLVRLARESIQSSLSKRSIKSISSKSLNEKRGVFVTLHKRGELRGCIGFPEPAYPLQEGVMHAAQAAAFEDPRFEPVTAGELKTLQIEVSVLTVPEQTKDITEIRVGVDGLILRNRGYSGLLLPQVATEYGWNRTQFLCNLSRKAGLSQMAWKEPGSSIYRFQAQIFSEDGGRIVERK